MIINFPYGKTRIPFEIEDSRISAVLESKAEEYKSELSQTEIVKKALASPIESDRLCDIAKNVKRSWRTPFSMTFLYLFRKCCFCGSEAVCPTGQCLSAYVLCQPTSHLYFSTL